MAASHQKNLIEMAMFLLRFCFLFVASFSFVQCSRKVSESKLPVHQEPDGQTTYSLTLEHSFDQGQSPKFFSRGTLSFRSNRQGQGMFIQTAALTAGEKRKLRELARNDGIYRIRVPSNLESNPDDGSVTFVSTFTRACALLQSRLTDDITIHIDQSVNVLGVSITPEVASCDQGTNVESSQLDNFNTTVSLSVMVPGPVPETQAYIAKIEEEKSQKEKGKGAENKSFFMKYWMYIVPVVIFVLLSSGGEQRS